jgi:hypothetical protein
MNIYGFPYGFNPTTAVDSILFKEPKFVFHTNRITGELALADAYKGLGGFGNPIIAHISGDYYWPISLLGDITCREIMTSFIHAADSMYSSAGKSHYFIVEESVLVNKRFTDIERKIVFDFFRANTRQNETKFLSIFPKSFDSIFIRPSITVGISKLISWYTNPYINNKDLYPITAEKLILHLIHSCYIEGYDRSIYCAEFFLTLLLMKFNYDFSSLSEFPKGRTHNGPVTLLYTCENKIKSVLSYWGSYMNFKQYLSTLPIKENKNLYERLTKFIS